MKLLDHQSMPSVMSLMQPFPYFAEPDTSVAQIMELMNKHQIRHIPIKQDDQVVGIVSERDLRWLRSPILDSPVTEEIPVYQVMTYYPYVVDIDTPLTTVVSEIAEQKIGAAIVINAGRLAGIVTLIDICRALGEILESEYGYRPSY